LTSTVYKILGSAEWDAARAAGRFEGSAVDRADGYIHFSGAGQVAETARRHFRDRTDLVLLAVDAAALGSALRFEPSRGGELFPHLYAALPTAAVRWAKPLPWDNGRHVFPDLDM
jgi:uncharacterized protein (DUF952 family)